MKLRLGTALAILCLVCTASSALAINHSGNISNTQTWAANDTHVVTGTVTVQSGGKLIIEAGATVSVNNYLTIQVNGNGTIQLHGTEAKPIIFKLGGNQYWQGIYLNNSAKVEGSIIKYVQIEKAQFGFYLNNATIGTPGSPIVLDHVTYTDIANYGVYNERAALVVRDSKFVNNNYGIYFNSSISNAFMRIERNEFRGWDNYAIYLANSSNQQHTIVRNNLIHKPKNSANYGIYASNTRMKILFNTLDGGLQAQRGIFLESLHNNYANLVAGNIITNFTGAGIYMNSMNTSDGYTTVEDNDAYNNQSDNCNYRDDETNNCNTTWGANVSVAPKFANTTLDDYTLTEQSLLFKLAQSNYPSITDDYKGNPRQSVMSYGAFERAVIVTSITALPNQTFIPRAGETVTFYINGEGFEKDCGVDVSFHLPGDQNPDSSLITITSKTVDSSTRITMTVQLSGIAAGQRDIVVTNLKNDSFAKCPANIAGRGSELLQIVPKLTLDEFPITPNQAVVGEKVSVKITGTGFYQGDVITLLTESDQVENSVVISNVKVVSFSEITADFQLLPGPTKKTPLKLRIKAVDLQTPVVTQNTVFTIRLQGTPTEHSGTLPGSDPGCNGNTCTWGDLNKVTGSITVPDGVTLTLEPGTEVFFDENTNITVQGTGKIVIKGSASLPVELKPTESGKLWSGIRLLSNNTDKLITNVNISGASIGFFVSAVTGLKFENVTITDSNQGYWLSSGSEAEIRDSFLDKVTDGVYVDGGSTLAMYRTRVTNWSGIGVNVNDNASKIDVVGNLFYLPGSTATEAIKLKGHGIVGFNTIDGRNNAGTPTANLGIDASTANDSFDTGIYANIVTYFKTAGIVYNTNNAKFAMAYNDAWMNNPTDLCNYSDKKDNNCHKAGPPSNPLDNSLINLSVDPRYRNSTAGDFRLAGDSTLYDAVEKLGEAPTHDYDNNPRIGDPDIGAWELPVVKTISPSYGIRGDTDLEVTITGHNLATFSLLLDSNVPNTGTQVTTSGGVVNSSTEVTAKLTIDAAALLGNWDVELTNTNDDTVFRAPGLFKVIDQYLQNLPDQLCIQDELCTIEFSVCTPDDKQVTVTNEPNTTPQVETLNLNKLSACNYSITFVARLETNTNDTEETTIVVNIDDTGHVTSKKSIKVTVRNKTLGNNKPSSVILDTPTDGAIVSTLTPELIIQNATDDDKDKLVYIYEVDVISNFDKNSPASEYITQTIDENTGGAKSSWKLETLLKNHTLYFWRVRAFDGLEYGEWSETFSFRVKTTNQPPTKPVAIEPIDGKVVSGPVAPNFVFFATDDDDGRDFTITFELYTDAGLSNKVSELVGIKAGPGPNTTLNIGGVLSDGNYYWRVKAVDPTGAESAWSETQHFVMQSGITPDGDNTDTVTPDVEGDTQTPDTDDDGVTPTPDTSGDDGVTPTPDASDDTQVQQDTNTPQQDAGDTGGTQQDTTTSGDTGKTDDGGGGGCQIANNNGSQSALLLLLMAFGALILRRRFDWSR